MNKLESFSSIQRWHRQLRKKASRLDPNAAIPKDTLRQCNAAIEKYCAFTGMNPDQLIEDYATEMRRTGRTTKHNDLMDLFWEQCPHKTTAGIYVALLKGFYKRNDCPLTVSTGGVPKIRDKDILLTSAQVRAICDVANLNHKSWILPN